MSKAFSSEVGTGSRQENASNKESSALQIRDIHVEYGSRVAISGISLDVAPALEIASDGTAEVQPQLKLAVALGGGFHVGPEYYANLGAVDGLAAPRDEWHQLFAALDVTRWKDVEINLALGFGLTAATDPFTVKTIVGFQF